MFTAEKAAGLFAAATESRRESEQSFFDRMIQDAISSALARGKARVMMGKDRKDRLIESIKARGFTVEQVSEERDIWGRFAVDFSWPEEVNVLPPNAERVLAMPRALGAPYGAVAQRQWAKRERIHARLRIARKGH